MAENRLRNIVLGTIKKVDRAKLHHADFEVVQSAVEQNVAALQFVTCEPSTIIF